MRSEKEHGDESEMMLRRGAAESAVAYENAACLCVGVRANDVDVCTFS